MADLPFLRDLKVRRASNESGDKYTIDLSLTGDLQLVESTEKLTSQLTRAVINDATVLKSLINQNVGLKRSATALVNLILRNFRQSQYNEVSKSDTNFYGYAIYRKASGSSGEYTLVSPKNVTFKFVDDALENYKSYDYGITKNYGKIFETDFVELMTLTPSLYSADQTVAIGRTALAIPGDKCMTFYVDYNRQYRGSDILDSVESISVDVDPAEPRRLIVQVGIVDLRGNTISISAKSANASTLR